MTKSTKFATNNQEKIINPITEIGTVHQEQIRIAKLLCHTSYKKLSNEIKNCGTHIQFIQSKKLDLLQVQSNFRCHSKICPYCAKAESNKLSAIIQKELELNEDFFQGKEFLFITLTVKNCGKEDLTEKVNDLIHGKRKLFNNKNGKLGKISEGSISTLEITVNEKTYQANRYHAHLHLIVCVNRDYFHRKDLYIDNKALSEYWQKTMNLDYLPIVDIRPFKKSDLREVCKYTVKTKQIKHADDLEAILKATFRRQLKTKTGCFNTFFQEAENACNEEYKAREEQIKHADDVEIIKYKYDYKLNCYVVDTEEEVKIDKSELIEILQLSKLEDIKN